MPKFKAVIFDMDGVIVDSEPLHVAAEKAACEYFGIDVPDYEWQGFKGMTALDIARNITAKYTNDRINPFTFVDVKTVMYLDVARKKLLPIPGALEFIASARKRFHRLALTTSSNRAIQELVFEKYSIGKHFDAVVNGDEIPAGFGKPDPQPYITTLVKLDVCASDAVVIEDSDNGIISAKRAGCTVIGITTSFDRHRLLDAGADRIVDSFSELQFL